MQRGGDARPRRRVGLRQVDARPDDRAAARADGRRDRLRGQAIAKLGAARAAAAAAGDADGLPGSVREPEPAQAGRLDHRRPAEDPRHRRQRERKAQVEELLETVGLSPEHYNRFPHEFSGGQRQRIGIARALALRPKLIVADEPVSALDVSIQSQMLNLLEDLQKEFQLTYIFIAHDLGVVRHVSDRIAVMYLGKLVELSPAEELYTRPIMPYTEALLSAVPIPDPDLADAARADRARGRRPEPDQPAAGCRFHPRCRYATEVCSEVEPPLVGLRERPPGRLPPPAERRRETLDRAAVSKRQTPRRRRREREVPQEPGKETRARPNP